jgi:hypothetical protein
MFSIAGADLVAEEREPRAQNQLIFSTRRSERLGF